jgi:hypothetical protein
MGLFGGVRRGGRGNGTGRMGTAGVHGERQHPPDTITRGVEFALDGRVYFRRATPDWKVTQSMVTEWNGRRDVNAFYRVPFRDALGAGMPATEHR